MIEIHVLLLIVGLFGAAIAGFLAFPMFGISGRDSEIERWRKDLCDYGDARWREGYDYGLDVATAAAKGCSVDTLRAYRGTAGREGWNARLGSPGEGSAVQEVGE